jgi:thiamine biosynthesis lipoprotein
VPLALASQAMGTRFELVLPGLDPLRERAAGEAALEAIAEWDARLSLFRRDSLIALVNREASQRAVALDPETFALLELCARVWRESGGAFDAALGRHMQRHGFRGAVERPAEAAGFEAVELERATCSVRLGSQGPQLDLGGIAKGFALDAAAEILRSSGIDQALVHGGTSTVIGLGAPPGQEGWTIALERGPQAPVAVLRDAALSVSAQHGRRNELGEGHVLDPRRGAPVPGEHVAAVIAPSGSLADAWSTALLVAGGLPPSAADSGVAGLIGEGPPQQRVWRRAGASGAFRVSAG